MEPSTLYTYKVACRCEAVKDADKLYLFWSTCYYLKNVHNCVQSSKIVPAEIKFLELASTFASHKWTDPGTKELPGISAPCSKSYRGHYFKQLILQFAHAVAKEVEEPIVHC